MLYYYYKRQERENAAIDVLRQAVLKFLENPQFQIALGNYYLKEEIYYRAREEHEEALIFQSGNIKMKKKLESLDQMQ